MISSPIFLQEISDAQQPLLFGRATPDHLNEGGAASTEGAGVAPGDQMWLNLAQLIRSRVADRSGNTLPVDMSSATYELRDLTPQGHGLSISILGLDTSYGFSAAPPVPECCGYDAVGFDPSSVDLGLDFTDPLYVFGTDECTNQIDGLDGNFDDWGSDNTGIASVTKAQVKGMTSGTTLGFTTGNLPTGEGNF